MGKWLSRVIEKEDSRKENFPDIPEKRTDKTDRVSAEVFFDGKENKSENLAELQSQQDQRFNPIFDCLTGIELEAYQEWLSIMISPEFGMTRKTAETEALILLARSSRVLQTKQAAKDYKDRGWIKIYSTVLGESVYLARDEKSAEKAPDKSLPVFLGSEIAAIKNLSREEAMLLMEARVLFGGHIGVLKNERLKTTGLNHDNKEKR